jgi:hypothetical protein
MEVKTTSGFSVDVHLNIEITAEIIASEKPNAVVIL